MLTVVSLLSLLLVLSACAVQTTQRTYQIAILGPFEGRYREVGYQALYAARLALSESGLTNVELLLIDDGGDSQIASERANALVNMDHVIMTVVLGFEATSPQSQSDFGDLPIMIAGYWMNLPINENVFVYAYQQIPDLLTINSPIDITNSDIITSGFIGTDILAIHQMATLHPDLTGVRIVSSASLPSSEFRQNYIESDQFAPEPTLVATLVYDATTYLLTQVNDLFETDNVISREVLTNVLQSDFENGFFSDAPLYFYEYTETNELISVESFIE